MWRASEWKGELSPTKISVRHFRLFSPSVMSGRLQVGKTKLQNINIYSQSYLRRFYTCTQRRPVEKQLWHSFYLLIAWRNRKTFILCLSSSNWGNKYAMGIKQVSSFKTPLIKKKMKWDGRKRGYQIPKKKKCIVLSKWIWKLAITLTLLQAWTISDSGTPALPRTSCYNLEQHQ